MNPVTKKILAYPIAFGFIGAFLGLLLRYVFTGKSIGLVFTNVLHGHSHIMLLGFIFNALLAFIWKYFTDAMDTWSYRYYLALQVCVVGMLISFPLQGYALYSILFSTLHLWISYVLLIRLWKRLKGTKNLVRLIKIGIVFHFISTIGPYCLGPMMVLKMKGSPWYQQAIYFYLHFQYLGVLFIWLLVVLLKRLAISLTKQQIIVLTLSLIGLYAHSLSYSFKNITITIVGGIASLGFIYVLFQVYKNAKTLNTKNKSILLVLFLLAFGNIVGSIPYVAELVANNCFLLIAWLHFIFLGVYTSFIWIEVFPNLSKKVWLFYAISLIISELLLVFPETVYELTNLSIVDLLFVAYLLVFICFAVVHLPYFLKLRHELTRTR